jgi:tRNA threonylcarbamoyl adenosine modification protein YeaZ
VLLALDTATPATSVAVADDSAVVAQDQVVDGRRHAEVLAPLISDVLSRADVDATQLTRIAVGVGPGPFTGLRVGLITALALGDALAVPVVGVMSLDVIAADVQSGASESTALLAVIDARRREVYWARYEDAGRTSGPFVASAHEVAAGNPSCRVAGEGADRYASEFESAGCEVLPTRYPSAAALARLTLSRLQAGAPFEPVVPLYLRKPDATVPGERKRVTPV